MKRDIEWLKKEFDEVVEFRKQSNPSSSWGMGSNTVLKYIKEDFKNLINQLDEPDYTYDAYREGFKEGERQTAEYFESIAEEPSKEQVWKYLSEHGLEVVERTANRYVVLTDNDFYVGSVSIRGDGTFRSLGATYSKDKALKFDKREHAQTIVDLFGQGRVKEIKE